MPVYFMVMLIPNTCHAYTTTNSNGTAFQTDSQIIPIDTIDTMPEQVSNAQESDRRARSILPPADKRFPRTATGGLHRSVITRPH